MKTGKIGNVILIVIAGITAISSVAAAGREGHGGGAFICSDPAKSEFLDLFEAKIPGIVSTNGLSIPSSNLPVKQQISIAFAKLNPSSNLYKKMMSIYVEVKNAKINSLPDGAEIAWPSDEKNALNKAGCRPIGIMLYNDTNNSILQDTKTLAQLSPQQQAAAWVHETVYKFMRETQGATDSIKARAVVGYLFSDISQTELDEALTALARLNPDASYTFGDKGTDNSIRTYDYGTSYQGEQVNFGISLVPSVSNSPDCERIWEVSSGHSFILNISSSGPYETFYFKGAVRSFNEFAGAFQMSPNRSVFFELNYDGDANQLNCALEVKINDQKGHMITETISNRRPLLILF